MRNSGQGTYSDGACTDSVSNEYSEFCGDPRAVEVTTSSKILRRPALMIRGSI